MNFQKFIKYIFLYFILVSLFGFSSCAFKKSLLFNVERNENKTDRTVSPQKPVAEEKIRIGNVLDVTNLQNDGYVNGLGVGTPIKLNYLVESDSTITLPLIGKVKIAGLTIYDAEKTINSAYSRSELKDPIIKLNFKNLKVTLLGEFLRAGNYEITPNSANLVEVIGAAGGFTTRANANKIKIIRGDLLIKEVIEVDLSKMASLTSSEIIMQSGDIVYCQPRRLFLITDKISPVISYISVGLSVLSVLFILKQ